MDERRKAKRILVQTHRFDDRGGWLFTVFALVYSEEESVIRPAVERDAACRLDEGDYEPRHYYGLRRLLSEESARMDRPDEQPAPGAG